ncbi:MAG: phosphoglucosamine mutase [Thermocladium sp.]
MGKLFGTNGIRLEFIEGKYDLVQITKIGEAIASYFNGGEVLMGRDSRTTGNAVSNIISGVLSMYGIEVHDMGLVPTPVLQYIVKAEGYDGGVMITASHNPPQYNGIKVMGKDGIEVSREEEAKIESLYNEAKPGRSYNEVKPIREIDAGYMLGTYEEHLLGLFSRESIKQGFVIAADFANSVASLVLPRILESLDIRLKSINGHLSGLFPGRLPEPRQDTLAETAKAVREAGVDFAVAFDGDGDRSIFITGSGEVIPGDRSGLILAESLLEEEGRGYIVTPVSSSSMVKTEVEKKGGKVVWTRVGSVDVSHTLMKVGGICGFEDNGGFIWPRHHPVRDGISTTLLMMHVLSRLGKSLDQAYSELPSMFLYRDRIEMPRERAMRIIEAIQSKVSNAVTIDGIRVDYDDSWFLIRPSGTENVLRITIEATSNDRLEELRKWIFSFISSVN